MWAVVNGVLLYLPVAFQGRFAAGWHVVLSMLAALGIGWMVHRLPRRRAQRIRNVLVILTVPSTLLALLAGPYMAISQGDYPFYLPRTELEAVEWLATQVDERDVVLASYSLGNFIPTRASCRVLVGHQFSSYALEPKLALLHRFFSAATEDSERRAILSEYGVTTVYYGSFEQRLGDFEPGQAFYLKEAYREDGVAIYAVDSEDGLS
jgi:hypothetical protein